MTNQKTIFKRVMLLAGALITLLVIMLAFTSHGNFNSSESYTVYSDEEYYSETTYYLTEEVYNKKVKGENQKSRTAKQLTTENGKEFVIAAEKKVWVAEKYDLDGNTTGSRLLKKSEVEKYNSSNDQIDFASADVLTSATHSLGSDSESYYALSIMLTADYYASTDHYEIAGFSQWDKKYSSTDKKQVAEKDYEDYAGFTWGGENTLQGSDYQMVGNYEDNSSLSASRCLTNSFAGVVWQFIEKNSLGSPLRMGSSYMHLTKIGALQNKMTSVRFTYIHTYDVVKGSVSLTVNSSGTVAGGITLSSAEKQWQIEIDLTGFEY